MPVVPAIGFDDAPFARSHRGDVPVVGAVYAGRRLEGVLVGKVRRDGANATRVLTELVRASRFAGHRHLVMLQGIALAGFNVIDVQALSRDLQMPVLVVVRKQPDLERIRRALLDHVPGGARKWRLIQQAGPVERVGSVHVQRVGLSIGDAARALERYCWNSLVPEPLRTAHLIAGGMVGGGSRQRV